MTILDGRGLGDRVGGFRARTHRTEADIGWSRKTLRRGVAFDDLAVAAREYFDGCRMTPILPGIGASGNPGTIQQLPLSGAEDATVFWCDGAAPMPAGQSSPVSGRTVARPGLLAALGILILGGCTFTDDDRSGTLPVVIVNEAVAR